MQVRTHREVLELKILLNLVELCRVRVDQATDQFKAILDKCGYVPQKEICHRVTLICDDAGPRIRFRFSFIDEETRAEPTRCLGSFYARVKWKDNTSLVWEWTGDY